MKIKFTTGLLLLAFALGSRALPAQETSPQSKDQTGATVTVAGCLQKGTTTDVFILTAKDGKSWEVTSNTVNLAPHVGHSVSLTGNQVNAESPDSSGNSTDRSRQPRSGSSAPSKARLVVSDLKMVSDSCPQ